MTKLRLIAAVALVMALVLPGGALAQESQGKVAVFPFQVFSQEPLAYLKTGLQDMMATRLRQEGVDALKPEEVNRLVETQEGPIDMTTARKLADSLGADFAVFGSLSKVGSRVSIDAKVLDVLGIRRPQTVFVEGAGLDSVGDLADQITREVAVLVSGREQVAEVKIAGNRRIEAEAIKNVIKTRAGGPYSPLRLDEDIRAIWKMGYFDDVQVASADSDKGKVVTFTVVEKPTLKQIQIEGNSALDDEEIREQIGIKAFSVYRPELIKEAEQKIVKLYRDKGYYDIKVSSEVLTLPEGELGVRFKINEGNKVFIQAIKFEGNTAFDSDDLRDEMETQEKGWLSWLTDDNVLERTKLDQDVQRVADYYYNHGYMEAKVSDPEIARGEDGLIITIKINEGPRYKISDVMLSGDMVVPREEVMPKLATKAGEWYNRDQLRKDLAYLTTLYADKGYAYVDVRPGIKQDSANHTVSVDMSISKGDKIYFEQIIITGNDRTRDKVIRREIAAAEGDLFSSSILRNANMRLHRMDFFEDVQISTSKGSAPDRMNLHVQVKEKRTGQISLGAGYSTQDGPMIMGTVAESNLFGRGQRLEFRGQLGGKSTRYTVSFTEPWLFDKPISAGVDLFNWQRDYLDYDKESIGGRLRFGFPFYFEYTRFYLYYKYEEADISNISNQASAIIRDQVGSHTTSSVRAILRRDSRDNIFNATEGSDNSLSVEYAGDPLGGTNAFVKVIGDTGWYFPLWLKHTFVVHGRIGWLTNHSGGDLPMYEKFYLGGINTMRGFDYQSISPRDPDTNDRIGGERMVLANIEYRFPLLTSAGLVGVLFFDSGNVWTQDEGYKFGDLRHSYGAGIRWMSPMGPLRLEYGIVMDPTDDEDSSNWEFSIGSMF